MFFPIRPNFILTFLHKISLFQFRNYLQNTYTIDAETTCICGINGSGKTNLLDAIYTLCYTKSYFSSTLAPTIMQGKDAYRIEGLFKQNNQTEQIVCKLKNGKKELSYNQILYEKQSDHIGKYTAVMIAPDDTELINEGSEHRRKWMDGILSQCNPKYLDTLMFFQKVLQQRNAWLKMYGLGGNPDFSLLDYYDNLLNEPGKFLFRERANFVNAFSPLLQKYYRQLSGEREEVQLAYQSDLQQNLPENWIKETQARDIRAQRTGQGPHKDDLIFQINQHPIKSYGSQGQKKSYLFALKLAQYEYIQLNKSNSPILLLDDVFEKLDQNRMEALLATIRQPLFGQVIITDTHEKRVLEAFGQHKDIGFVRL